MLQIELELIDGIDLVDSYILKQGRSWNKLGSPGTSWNHLERAGTN